MKRIGTVAVGAAAIALGIGAGSLASWMATGTPPASDALVFGTLNLRSEPIAGGAEGAVWMDASMAGQPRPIDPATFLASAGDTLRMGHLFTLEAEGDNLAYELRVEWDPAPDLPAGVTAVYSVTENPMDAPDSTVHASQVPVGTPLQLPPAGAGDRLFLLDVVVEYADDRPDVALADAGLADLGRLVISADQTREGSAP